jgi:hypothetical protein
MNLQKLKEYREGLTRQRAEIDGALQLLEQLIQEEEAGNSASSESADNGPQENNAQGQ